MTGSLCCAPDARFGGSGGARASAHSSTPGHFAGPRRRAGAAGAPTLGGSSGLHCRRRPGCFPRAWRPPPPAASSSLPGDARRAQAPGAAAPRDGRELRAEPSGPGPCRGTHSRGAVRGGGQQGGGECGDAGDTSRRNALPCGWEQPAGLVGGGAARTAGSAGDERARSGGGAEQRALVGAELRVPGPVCPHRGGLIDATRCVTRSRAGSRWAPSEVTLRSAASGVPARGTGVSRTGREALEKLLPRQEGLSAGAGGMVTLAAQHKRLLRERACGEAGEGRQREERVK